MPTTTLAAPALAAPPGPPGQSARGLIRSLTGLRAVMAWVVLVVHLTPYTIDLVPALGPVALAFWRHHYVAIDTFFLLSGYVLTSGYAKRFASRPSLGVYGRFLWARLARFYPLHLAVLAALVAAALVGPAVGMRLEHGGNLGPDLLRHVFLLQGWGGAGELTWNGPSWTVSSEWFCYLIAPLVVMGALRLRRPTAILTGYVAALGAVVGAYCVLGFDETHLTSLAPLWRAVGGFVAGAMLYRLTTVDSRLPALCGRRTGALVLLWLGAIAGLAVLGASSMWSEPILGLVLLGLAQQRESISRVLSSRFMVRAGELSVALYLTHVPFLMLASRFVDHDTFPGLWGPLGLAVLAVGASGAAYLAFRLVERPAQRLMGAVVR